MLTDRYIQLKIKWIACIYIRSHSYQLFQTTQLSFQLKSCKCKSINLNSRTWVRNVDSRQVGDCEACCTGQLSRVIVTYKEKSMHNPIYSSFCPFADLFLEILANKNLKQKYIIALTFLALYYLSCTSPVNYKKKNWNLE